ncbi:hypothetical protein DES43_12563 [Aquamicrobium defluvii]|uniref:Uncharacterized protein n=1 Tax=Aquamicrobium defluvii TaxID=69279 RepID=A0A4R6YBE4_9HYPH|nr:hypothetical protein DES43_12563 [Aquamicrobium defluvii]
MLAIAAFVFGIGFLLGFLTWNVLFTLAIYASPAIWLPHHLGYTGTLVASLLLLASIAVLVLRFSGRVTGRLPRAVTIPQSFPKGCS